MTDDDYYTIRTGGTGEGDAHRPRPLRVAAMFVAGALAITVIAVPMMRDAMDEVQLAQRPADLDMRSVGSIGGPARGAPRSGARDGKRYVVRRSVLTGSSVCIMRSDGSRSGSC